MSENVSGVRVKHYPWPSINHDVIFSSAFYNKYHRHGGLNSTTTSQDSGGWEGQDQSAHRAEFWWEPSSRLQIVTWWREEALLSLFLFFIRALIPSWGIYPHRLIKHNYIITSIKHNYSLNTIPNTIILELCQNIWFKTAAPIGSTWK